MGIRASVARGMMSWGVGMRLLAMSWRMLRRCGVMKMAAAVRMVVMVPAMRWVRLLVVAATAVVQAARSRAGAR